MNKLVTMNYQIAGKPDYSEMADVCLASYKANLEGSWEALVLSGDMRQFSYESGMERMFSEMFAAVRGLHEAGDNVLLVDPDTVCVKPTRIFGRFREYMRLFWHTTTKERYGFNPYLNGGVVYIPAECEMPGGVLLDEFTTNYDDNQRVFNAWFYSQSVITPRLYPELNWSPEVSNPLPRKDAHILHFHASKGHALEQMREAFNAG